MRKELANIIKDRPELQGEELDNAINKKLEEMKKLSMEEKKQGYLPYRGNMLWAGIKTQKQFDKKRNEVLEDYKNGNFFIERLGRHREVDFPLTMTIVNLRREWIKEYDIKTAPEYMLIDAAFISYFHFIRLNEAINNNMASIEWNLFMLDVPSFVPKKDGVKFTTSNSRSLAENLAHRLTDVLQPVLEQYNRMLIKNLKALRDLRRGNILLNIGIIGQMNLGDKQINVGNDSGDDSKKEL